MVVIISSDLSSHHGCLPEDMVVNEILPKLPVQSLLRFKRVSKKWFDLIANDSRFVSAHLRHHSNATQLSIILARYSSSRRSRYRTYRTRSLLLVDEPNVVESDMSYIPTRPDCTGEHRIVGSSNGLVCVVNFYDTILWNPATREWRNVPEAPFPPFVTEVGWGFGFDQKSKNYKVIRILQGWTFLLESVFVL